MMEVIGREKYFAEDVEDKMSGNMRRNCSFSSWRRSWRMIWLNKEKAVQGSDTTMSKKDLLLVAKKIRLNKKSPAK